MANGRVNPKPIGELAPEDFRRHPFWSTSVDDADVAVPVELTSPLDNFRMLYVHCTFALHDGTFVEGTLLIDLSDKHISSISIFKGDEEFIFPLGQGPWSEHLEELANWLERPAAAVSTVKYTTPFFFEEGTPISGEIDLKNP